MNKTKDKSRAKGLGQGLPELDKVVIEYWEEGWIVGISAFKGEDLKLDVANNKLLADELVKLGLDFIGPNESVWDGVSEEGFLVNVHSQNNLNKLYELGIRFNQDWVAVWEAPIISGVEIQPVAATDNHTKLDGYPFTIIKDDVSKYAEFKNRHLNENTYFKANNMNQTKARSRAGRNKDSQGFTLDVNGNFHLIKKPQDLYDLYNDWLIDHNGGVYVLTEEELQIVEEIRDSYNAYYNAIVSNGIRYIKLDDFELYAKEELGLAISNVDLIEEINPNVIVQTVDLDELKKAIRNRRKGGEDESGSGGLWDFAFETTLSYIWRELDIDGFTNEEHYAYQRLAEEVYNILVMNEDNYMKGKRGEIKWQY